MGRKVAFHIGERINGPALYNKTNKINNVDVEFRSHCRFLQEVKVYLTLSYAIKHGDVGHIRKMLPILAILFYGAGQNNYGKEMLYFDWLLRPQVSDPVLRDAILSASLVPTASKNKTWKAFDREGEHYNLWLANQLRQGKNGTHTLDSVFFRDSFLAGHYSSIRRIFIRSFGHTRNAKHKTRNTRSEIAERAQFLLRNGWLVEGHTSRQLNTGWESLDILTQGQQIMSEKIQAFNDTVPRDKDGWQSNWPETADEERWPLEPDAREAFGEDFLMVDQEPAGEGDGYDFEDPIDPMTQVMVEDMDAITLEEMEILETE